MSSGALLAVPSRRSMKKESNSGSMDKTTGRPSSGNSSSSSRSSSQPSHRGKDKTKDKGPSKEEILKANLELSDEVETLSAENQVLKSTLSSVIDKLIENAKIKGVKIPAEVENPHVTEVSAETLVSFTEQLTAEAHKSNTMEYRVEELETRITHMNMELAKLLRSRVAIENGLDEIVQDCESLDVVKKKSRELLRDIRSTALFTFLDSVPRSDVDDSRRDSVSQLDLSLPNSPAGSVIQTSTPRSSFTTQPPPPRPTTVVLNNQNLDLTPPAVKLPGDTHIKNMHKDLRQYIVQQLSLPKGNGADWRLMAERMGIPAETINQWKRWKLDQPMFYVLQTWSQSAGASVRMLHRHLVSPQMRLTLLAKRISDFYKVD